VLVPAPDYPLWTAVVSLSGGTPVHYRCDEATAGCPIWTTSAPRSRRAPRRIVVINPNNPTGALYPDELLRGIVELAREHGLIIFADEIYDKVLYDGVTHTSIASLAEDVLFLTFNGLSKNYRSCGYRAGWMVVSGDKKRAKDYIEGLNMLASMRLCANVPGQLAIQTALGGYQSIKDLVAPGGRLRRQRDLAYELLTQIPGVSCVKPKAALYMFPRLDPKMYPIADDQQFAYELLAQEKVLLVQGTGFNWPEPDHFRSSSCPTPTTCRGHRPHRPLPGRLPQASRQLSPIRGQSLSPAFSRLSIPMKPIQVGLLGIGTVGAAPSTCCSATRRNSASRRPGHRDHHGGRLDVERARSIVGEGVAWWAMPAR
jgi:aspartate/methionine/tyrosine aminotransferase